MIWIVFIKAFLNIFCNASNNEKQITNCVIFIGFLIFDIFLMIIFKNIQRQELIVHHIVSIIIYIPLYTQYAYLGNILLLTESLSLMNSFLRKPKLTYYRIAIICCIRLPVWIYAFCFTWTSVYINSMGLLTILYYLGPLFFVLYDLKMIMKLCNTSELVLNQ